MPFATELIPSESPRLDPEWPYPIWHHANDGPISVRLMTGENLRDTLASIARWLAAAKGNEVVAMWWSVMDDEIARRIGGEAR